ncbi:MAG TPA: DPP IV N-terminal domain-containing protein [Candidatus Polarisedimenticolia bacterium]|nr:DPP IV N-terminal domain-containing protein [Candidatus Polarisedimenticolia bacterium]
MILSTTLLTASGLARADELTLARVARFPPPGARVATQFRFSHDGRFLYFLALLGPGPERSLVREEVATGKREVIGRGSGDAAALTPDEILRRERQRIQDLGITEYVLAEKADVAVFVSGGDLYLAHPGGTPARLAEAGRGALTPQLSFDGRRLAFVRDGDLQVFDLQSRAIAALTRGATGTRHHAVAEYIAQEEMDRPLGFWWSPDGRFLAWEESDESAIPEYPIVHQGRPAWDVERPRYPFAGGPNAKVRLGVVASSGGSTRWLTLAPAGEDFYLARVRFGPDGALYAQVQSRDQKRLRLVRFAPPAWTATTLLEERSDTWVDLHDDFRPLEDGRFLWSSARTGWKHLELRGADGRLVRSLTSGAWPVDRLEGIDEQRGEVFFTAARDSPLHKPVYRVSLEGGAIARVTPEDGFHAAVFARDGRRFVDVHDTLSQPPKALLRAVDGTIERVLDANDDPEVRALGLVAPELVTVPGPDGSVLHGAIYHPPEGAPGGPRHPAIVRVYGGPTAQTVKDSWELTQDLRAQYLARRGYVVFRLDNRGTPRRGGPFERSIHRRLGTLEVEDQAAGARWLASRPDVDGARLGVYGWSYGGYMTLLCLLRAPDVFRAGVAGAPVTDWDGYDTHYTEQYMGTPQDNPDGYRNGSVLPLAGKLERPLLIIHGLSDENVHFRHTARLLNVLNPAHRAYDLLAFPDERHLPRGQDDREELEARLVAHFDRALGHAPPGEGTAGPR